MRSSDDPPLFAVDAPQRRRTCRCLCLLQRDAERAGARGGQLVREPARRRLGRRRTQLANHGIGIDFESTHYGQGLSHGAGSDDFEYAGRLDSLLHVDTEKAGAWQGGSLRVHAQYRFGDAPANRGGVLLPVNTGVVLPLGEAEEIVASSVFLTNVSPSTPP